MSEQAFEASVHRLSQRRDKRPFLFNIGLSALIASGFLYLLLIVPVQLVLIYILSLDSFYVNPFLIPTVILLIPLLFHTIYSIYRMLSYRANAPEGIILVRSDAPQLYELIDFICRELDCGPIFQIRIVNQTTAFVTQLPTWGVFGGYRNYLYLGMPIMHLLNCEQMRAVIAHELAHISKKHGYFSIWAARMYTVWDETIQRISSSLFGTLFFAKFYHWFIRRLHARTLVLKQFHERQADQYAAQLAGEQNIADSLALLEIWGLYEKRGFYEDYYSKSTAQAEPAPIYPHYQNHIRCMTQKECDSLYHAVLNVETEFDDSHPSLKDRIEAVHAAKQPPALPHSCCRESWFTAPFIDRCEDAWKADQEIIWGQYHEERAAQLSVLQDLSQKPMLTSEEKDTLLNCILNTSGYRASIDMAEKIDAEDPYNCKANYYLGCHKAIYGDRSAIEMLMVATNKDLKLFGRVDPVLATFFKFYGNKEEYNAFAEKYSILYQKYGTYHSYINHVYWNVDEYYGQTDPSIAEDIRQVFVDLKHIKKVYLTKKTEYYNEHVYLVLFTSPVSTHISQDAEHGILIQKIRCLERKHHISIILVDEKELYKRDFASKMRVRMMRLK